MKGDPVDKIGWTVLVFLMLLFGGFFILLGWGFVEVIQWITSK